MVAAKETTPKRERTFQIELNERELQVLMYYLGKAVNVEAYKVYYPIHRMMANAEVPFLTEEML